MEKRSLAIFGSAVREEARPESDVDFLVEFQGPATFNGYMDLKFLSEDQFDRAYAADGRLDDSVHPK
jgi:predicted nucleotidyltransferase